VRRDFSSVAEWDHLKRELRAEDARAVRDQQKTDEQLKRENAHFSAHGSVRLVFDPSRI
jgi:hypothetical protein